MAMEEFNKKKNNLETQKAEAEAMMDGAEVGRLEQELAQLEANKHTYETVTAEVTQDATENQIKQITELGGSEEVLHEKMQEKNEEVEKIEGVIEEKALDGNMDNKNTEVKEREERAKEIQDSIQYFIDGYPANKENIISLHSWVEKAIRENIPFDQEKVSKILNESFKGGQNNELSFDSLQDFIKAQDLEKELGVFVEKGESEEEFNNKINHLIELKNKIDTGVDSEGNKRDFGKTLFIDELRNKWKSFHGIEADLKKTYESPEVKQKLINTLQLDGVTMFNSGSVDVALAQKMLKAGIISQEDLGNGVLVSLNNLFQKHNGNMDALAGDFGLGYVKHLDSEMIQFLKQDPNIKGLMDKVLEDAQKKIAAGDLNVSYYQNLVDKLG